jgi:hypothetical protein
MDRVIVNPFESLEDIDFLKMNVNALVGLGKLAGAIIGDGFVCNDMTCTESSVPNMNVNLSASELYQLLVIDATAYGSLPSNSDPLVKQGINLDPTVIPLTAPATVGNSINYLIQAQINEADTDSQNRQFFNGTPPSYEQTINTRRADTITFQAKAGASAPTGTQSTPTPDAGFCGCFVVTVDQGQTAIVNADISRYTSTGAVTFLDEKLQDKISQTTGDGRYVLQSNSVNFRAVRTGSQSINVDTETKILLNSAEYNVNNGFITASNRFQPTIAGYYYILGSVALNFTGATGFLDMNVWLYKNGIENTTSFLGSTGEYGTLVLTVSDIIFLNGSTDFIELFTFQNSSLSSVPLVADPDGTFLTGFKTP